MFDLKVLKIIIYFILVIFFISSFSYAKDFRDESYCKELEEMVFCVDLESVNFKSELFKKLEVLLLEDFTKTFLSIGRILDDGILKQKPLIILLNEKRFLKATNAPSWASAIFKNNIIYIKLNLKKPIIKKRILRTFRHEIVHYYVFNLSKGLLPEWFDEGLAVYFSGLSAHDLRNYNKTLNFNLILDKKGIKKINNQKRFTRLGKKEAKRAYKKAKNKVSSLILNHGLASIKKYLKGVSEGKDYKAYYEEVFKEKYIKAF